MPYRNPTPCTTPGCNNNAPAGRGQCASCVQRARSQRSNTTKRYDTQAWRETSAAFLRANPWCQREGCTQRSAEAHHIDGQGPTSPRGFDWANLEALCKRHHSQVTATMTGFHKRR